MPIIKHDYERPGLIFLSVHTRRVTPNNLACIIGLQKVSSPPYVLPSCVFWKFSWVTFKGMNGGTRGFLFNTTEGVVDCMLPGFLLGPYFSSVEVAEIINRHYEQTHPNSA